MEILTSTRTPAQIRHSPCTILAVAGRQRSPDYKELDAMVEGQLSAALQQGQFRGECGQHMLITFPRQKHQALIVVGLGRLAKLNRMGFIKAARAAAAALVKYDPKTALCCFPEVPRWNNQEAWTIRCLALELQNAAYQYSKTLSKKPKRRLQGCTLLVDKKRLQDAQHAVRHAHAIHAGVSLTRELGNLPPNLCTPADLASHARALGRRSKRVQVKVLEERSMERLGMGAFLAVSQGSDNPGKLVCLHYRGGRAREKPIALVGKGITFDTGGISIKPSPAMDEMKFDMCGAATVLGVMQACINLRLPINLIGLLACAENMPGGHATRPGDVVKTMSGKTVEILNTDAEGRLVLCDALSYAARHKPKIIIDVATLTGACVVALGHEASGVMGNNQPLINQLLQAGEKSGDRAWQLPMWEEYQPQLDSNFADLANIGGRWGGTITAACFLSHFVRDYHWAHLDVAGTAWHSGGKKKGATGRPVPLLIEFLLTQLAAA